MDDLKGKVALVTGASRGLGEGAARELAARGASVMLVARDGAAVERVVAATRARFGGLDILVNNAGVIEPIAEIATSDPAAWARNLQINLVGAYNVVRAVLPGMLAARAGNIGGTIIDISSGAAYRPLEGWSAYCAGKAGLAMLTNAIALETAGKGIRVFGFSPGTIDTEMQVKIRASGMNVISKIPRGDLLPVAHAVRGLVYLCTGAADDLQGTDASMRDDAFRQRIGLG